MSTFLWVIVPYICLAVFVVGHFWRYRYDKFGWTTRSSQLYEDRMLRIGDDPAIDPHPPSAHPPLGLAARTQPELRQHAGDAVAGVGRR